ncbi:hypothetical protein [Kaarinaea lacus]
MTTETVNSRTVDNQEQQENIFKNEIILNWLVRRKASPVTLGIGFFFLVPLPMTIWSIAKEGEHLRDLSSSHISFIENISWSFSTFYLFPFIIALSLVYYKAIPDLFFNQLIGKVAIPVSNDTAFLEKYKKEFYDQFNHWWIPVLAIVIAVTMTSFYLPQVRDYAFESWMFHSQKLTRIGMYAIGVQVVLGYWMLNLFIRALVFSKLLNDLFNDKRFTITLNAAHSDNACGLRSIFRVTSILNIILFLAGIYLSLIVIDKWVVQEVGLFGDISGPVMLATYALVAPLLFFLPLWAPHNAMWKAKEAFIQPVCYKLENNIKELNEAGGSDESKLSLLTKLREERLNLLKQIPVWPFDIKSLNAFFGAIIMPVVPVILPAIVNSISKL